MLHRGMILSFVLLFVFVGTPQAEEKKRDKNRYEDDDIVVRVIPRNKENIIAFYQGRGFPQSSYDEINKVCYVTFLIRNKSHTVHWLELENWKFIGKEEGFKRLDLVCLSCVVCDIQLGIIGRLVAIGVGVIFTGLCAQRTLGIGIQTAGVVCCFAGRF